MLGTAPVIDATTALPSPADAEKSPEHKPLSVEFKVSTKPSKPGACVASTELFSPTDDSFHVERCRKEVDPSSFCRSSRSGAVPESDPAFTAKKNSSLSYSACRRILASPPLTTLKELSGISVLEWQPSFVPNAWKSQWRKNTASLVSGEDDDLRCCH